MPMAAAIFPGAVAMLQQRSQSTVLVTIGDVGDVADGYADVLPVLLRGRRIRVHLKAKRA